MSHTYLLDLYDLIDQRLEKVFAESGVTNLKCKEKSFQKGQEDILREFKQFLADNYNNKLPRRIRAKFSG